MGSCHGTLRVGQCPARHPLTAAVSVLCGVPFMSHPCYPEAMKAATDLVRLTGLVVTVVDFSLPTSIEELLERGADHASQTPCRR